MAPSFAESLPPCEAARWPFARAGPRVCLEALEDRTLPSAALPGGTLGVEHQIVALTFAAGQFSVAAPGSRQVEEGLSRGFVQVIVDGQAFSSDPASPAFDPALAGAGANSLHGIDFRGGGQSTLTLDGQQLAGNFTVTSDSPLTVAGAIAAGGTVSLTAPALTVSGAVRGTAISLQSSGTLQLLSGATVSARAGMNGGSVSVAAAEVLNGGTIQADGGTGGTITVHAGTIMNFGAVTADGSIGFGGTVAETFTTSYLDTTSAQTGASGVGKGGQISLNGGTVGRLFTSGRFDVSGSTGGSIELFGKDALLIGATVDASGSADAGGKVTVLSQNSTDFAGTISATGGRHGGFVEVSSHGTVTDSGQADAGRGGTLLLDPQNLIIGAAPVGGLPQFNLVNPGTGGTFGSNVQVLSTGNVVVVNPQANNNTGAVYLFNGRTGALLSTLTGSITGSNGDQLGSGGLTVLPSGNFVVASPNWSGGKGAVTWFSGTTGLSGVVSASNSLVGAKAGDDVGGFLGLVTVLSNGNYVVGSPDWNGGVGAATWGSGTSGARGLVSASNSIVGSHANDNVGSIFGSVLVLTNGNYVVTTPSWNGNVGASTWAKGTTSTAEVISQTNSLVGSTAGDMVGLRGTSLSNGNYVVGSPFWNGNTGEVTWSNGTTGVKGIVSASNSLIGMKPGDAIGGSSGLQGGGIFALTNGNYVVCSPNWNNNIGAATLEKGTAAVTGAFSGANSLTGSASGDDVGGFAFGLSNGNYVVSSALWHNRTGAATWQSGTTAVSAVVSASNSLVGSAPGDEVGGLIDRLPNGNYLVESIFFDQNRGAVTFGKGTTGISGVVSTKNSLVDLAAPAGVAGAEIAIVVLANGNYVVGNQAYPPGGAITWGSGTSGVSGAISASNSLVGQTANELGIPTGVTPLANGNYVVRDPLWNQDRGLAVLEHGTVPLHGVLSSTGALVGTTPKSSTTTGDEVGEEIVALSNGNYVVVSASWNKGQGAVTWVNGSTGATFDGSNTPDAENSLVGSATNAGLSLFGVQTGPLPGSFLATFSQHGGTVAIGITDPTELTFALGQAQTVSLPPAFLTASLDAGTSVILQASQDITVDSSILVKPTGAGVIPGNLTLEAGRSILLNASINTAGGNLSLVANDSKANGVINSERGPGNAVITMTKGVTLNTGAGKLSIDLETSTDKTNNGKAAATLLGVTASTVTLSAATVLGFTLDGTVPGTGSAGTYTRTTVTGSIDLGKAKLDVVGETTFTTGQSFVILTSTKPITTTFAGLPEGSTVSDGTQQFKISYKNDVVTLTEFSSLVALGTADLPTSADWLFTTPTAIGGASRRVGSDRRGTSRPER